MYNSRVLLSAKGVALQKAGEGYRKLQDGTLNQLQACRALARQGPQ